MNLTHLQRLEAESIHIMREVVAEADNPVMLYSIGKDSSVMLHLAIKAFYPAKLPFPLLHVDTAWKFREMIEFRDDTVRRLNLDLVVHVNPDGAARGIDPFVHGTAIHTHVMKTEGLKQALDLYGFDVAFGGARRDEEKSRAKERVFSFRSAQHRWDPKNQRPELWRLYNARKHKGESIRVFPLSNWTELDIWQYIHLERIPIVPLYFAARRPVVQRDGVLVHPTGRPEHVAARLLAPDGNAPALPRLREPTAAYTGALHRRADHDHVLTIATTAGAAGARSSALRICPSFCCVVLARASAPASLRRKSCSLAWNAPRACSSAPVSGTWGSRATCWRSPRHAITRPLNASSSENSWSGARPPERTMSAA